MSIDDLLVLKRLLPTPGAFVHYIDVRQSVAGMRNAHLFDEFDHLGAYITKNRFDKEIADQLAGGKSDMLIWDGMSRIVDSSFEGEDWESKPFPTQLFPGEVQKLLGALDSTRAEGWLSAESHIRDFGEEARDSLANFLIDLGKTLHTHPSRYFMIGGEGKALFVWMQRAGEGIEWKRVKDKAIAAALSQESNEVVGVFVEVRADATYSKARRFTFQIPSEKSEENAHIYEDVKRMSKSDKAAKLAPQLGPLKTQRKPKVGRNERCPCGSGKKYKKCHGR